MRLTAEIMFRVTCRDCDFSVEAYDAQDAAWDHIGKYDEHPKDHTVEAIQITTFRMN
jgi:hypothetical protein